MFFLMNRQCSIPFQPSFISLSNSEKILYFWCPPKICVGNMDSCEHFQEKLRKHIFEEESVLKSSEEMCWACGQLWKLEENLRKLTSGHFWRRISLMSSEKMCWARRQFPARLALLLLLLLIAGLNLLLWQVETSHQNVIFGTFSTQTKFDTRFPRHKMKSEIWNFSTNIMYAFHPGDTIWWRRVLFVNI